MVHLPVSSVSDRDFFTRQSKQGLPVLFPPTSLPLHIHIVKVPSSAVPKLCFRLPPPLSTLSLPQTRPLASISQAGIEIPLACTLEVLCNEPI